MAGVGFAALLFTATANAKPLLDSAQSFTILSSAAITSTNSAFIIGDVGIDHGGAITLTDSAITGDVYVGGAFTNTRSTISGSLLTNGVANAEQAYDDFRAAYLAVKAMSSDHVISSNLAGQSLTPGVYSLDAASTTTGGTLTLDGSSADIWIFKIGTGGTGALTGTNFNVVLSSGELRNNNVYWWTAQAVTMTDSIFIGNILAGTSITVTRGSLRGRALATVAVTLTDTTVSSCGPVP